MNFILKEYRTNSGEVLLYNGYPDFQKLEELSKGAGDIWHSSFEQGYKNAFPELVYQTAVFFWYLNDFDDVHECVSWRINPNAFAVRKSVWEIADGFDADFENPQMQGLDFGYRAIRYLGGITLYERNLFPSAATEKVIVSRKDRHLFFRKNHKMSHAIFMIYRLGLWKVSEWKALWYARKNYKRRSFIDIIPSRKLHPIRGNPKVSYIIPTMLRQEFTVQLLDDLSLQKYLPTQVVVVDATPIDGRKKSLYQTKKYPFELIIKWQETVGSCRARNEAIALCTGEYIIFGDDDIRIPSNFILNHIRLLQTYDAGACNGMDIRADHSGQDLTDLKKKMDAFGDLARLVGVTENFSNANSCVKRQYVDQLIGNDVNFDGGYGEDSDFGLSLAKIGVTVLFNPFSVNLHLKPSSGGYRFWGAQSKIIGKKRKKQPWELDSPVKWIKPVPSPTIIYGIIKQFTPQQLTEYKQKHFFLYLFKGSKRSFLYRLIRIPYKYIQFSKSVCYAKKLFFLGIKHK